MQDQLGNVLLAVVIVVIYGSLITLLYGSFRDIFIPDTIEMWNKFMRKFK